MSVPAALPSEWRMMMALGKGAELKMADVFIATIGDAAYVKAFGILNDLRNNGVSCEIDYEKKSLKAQMRTADSTGAKRVLIIGEDEIAKGEAVLRDMKTKEQISVKFTDVLKTVNEKLKTYCL